MNLFRTPENLVLFTVVALATLPFINKPFHIDDTGDLQYVEQILRAPHDPYGFQFDWDEGLKPAHRHYHPPLKFYYQALFAWLLPQTEWTAHAAMLPFVLLAAWGLVGIAKRFGSPPAVVLVGWMLGPGYLPGQNVMLDVPAIGLALGATRLFIAGVDRNEVKSLLFAGGLLAAALLCKYSATVYLAVWVVYLALFGRIRHWLVFAPAALMVGLWALASWRLYGFAQPLMLLQRAPGHSWGAALPKLIPLLVFLGGAMPFAWLVLLRMGSRAQWSVAIAVPVALVVGFLFPPQRSVSKLDVPELDWPNLAWWGLLLSGAVAMFIWFFGQAVATFEAVRRRLFAEKPRDSITFGQHKDILFLLGWIVAAMLIQGFASPFLAMRRVVELAVPCWILLLRTPKESDRITRWGGAAATALIGIAVAGADYEFASAYKDFARQMKHSAPLDSRRLVSHGYWGWHFYPSKFGFDRFSKGQDPPSSGAILVIPQQAAKPADPGIVIQRVGNHPVQSRIPIRLMHYQAGAGYYGAAWGPLPYAWSNLPVESFRYYECLGDDL